MSEPKKLCVTCKEEKDLEEFGKHPLGKHGRKSSCKKCESAYQRNLYQAAKLKLESEKNE